MSSTREAGVDLIEAITARRSVGRMKPEAPPRALIEKVLAAAVHAPNHHNSQPWRFFVFANEAREELAEAWCDALADELRATGVPEEKARGLLLAERAK